MTSKLIIINIYKIFQLTRSRGAWLISLIFDNQLYHFNSHAHVERDEYDQAQDDWSDDFNSHAHVERDEYDKSQDDWSDDFNSHAHVERDMPMV